MLGPKRETCSLFRSPTHRIPGTNMGRVPMAMVMGVDGLGLKCVTSCRKFWCDIHVFFFFKKYEQRRSRRRYDCVLAWSGSGRKQKHRTIQPVPSTIPRVYSFGLPVHDPIHLIRPSGFWLWGIYIWIILDYLFIQILRSHIFSYTCILERISAGKREWFAGGNKACMSDVSRSFPHWYRGRGLSDTAGDDVMAVNDDEKFGPWARPVVQVPHEYGKLMKSHCFFQAAWSTHGLYLAYINFTGGQLWWQASF